MHHSCRYIRRGLFVIRRRPFNTRRGFFTIRRGRCQPEHIGVLLSETSLIDCADCPRMVALRETVRRDYPSYHAAPVAAWNVRGARLLMVGLAPGMHGANATGRPFTGDASGVFLFAALHRAGFSSSPMAADAVLQNASITNAVKCLPPANKPLAAEIAQCRKYLIAEIESFAPAGGSRLRRPRCILCLGRLAHDAVIKAMALAPMAFGHGEVHRLAERLYLMDTYHPSRQNTNTGRLTAAMLDSVFQRIRTLL